MRTSKLLGVVCAAWIALSMGAPHAGASTSQSGGHGLPDMKSSPLEHQSFSLPLPLDKLEFPKGDQHKPDKGEDPGRCDKCHDGNQDWKSNDEKRHDGDRKWEHKQDPGNDCRTCNDGHPKDGENRHDGNKSEHKQDPGTTAARATTDTRRTARTVTTATSRSTSRIPARLRHVPRRQPGPEVEGRRQPSRRTQKWESTAPGTARTVTTATVGAQQDPGQCDTCHDGNQDWKSKDGDNRHDGDQKWESKDPGQCDTCHDGNQDWKSKDGDNRHDGDQRWESKQDPGNDCRTCNDGHPKDGDTRHDGDQSRHQKDDHKSDCNEQHDPGHTDNGPNQPGYPGGSGHDPVEVLHQIPVVGSLLG